ncbi:hypothetical protein MTO96_039714 [Rhipicephalus appendiculatus]
MDAENFRGPPGQQSSRSTGARKRGNSPTDTVDTELYSASGDDWSDDNFIPVWSKGGEEEDRQRSLVHSCEYGVYEVKA